METTSPPRSTNSPRPKRNTSQERRGRTATAGKVDTNSSNSIQINKTEQVTKRNTVSETVSNINKAGQTSQATGAVSVGDDKLGHPNNSAAKAGANSVGGNYPGHPNNSAPKDAAHKANTTVSKQGGTAVPTYASKLSANEIDPSRDPRLTHGTIQNAQNNNENLDINNRKRRLSSPEIEQTPSKGSKPTLAVLDSKEQRENYDMVPITASPPQEEIETGSVIGSISDSEDEIETNTAPNQNNEWQHASKKHRKGKGKNKPVRPQYKPPTPPQVEFPAIVTGLNKARPFSKMQSRVAALNQLGITVQQFWTLPGIDRTLVSCPNSATQHKLAQLEKVRDCPILVNIPGFSSVGVIYGIPVYHQFHKVVEMLKSANKHIKKVDRLKNADGSQSRAVKIVFSTSPLPRDIFYDGERKEISPYTHRLMICKKCQGFQHHKAQCKATRHICAKCGNEGHGLGVTCPSRDYKCAHCAGGHHTNNVQACPAAKCMMLALQIQAITGLGAQQVASKLPTLHKYTVRKCLDPRAYSRQDFMDKESRPGPLQKQTLIRQGNISPGTEQAKRTTPPKPNNNQPTENFIQEANRGPPVSKQTEVVDEKEEVEKMDTEGVSTEIDKNEEKVVEETVSTPKATTNNTGKQSKSTSKKARKKLFNESESKLDSINKLKKVALVQKAKLNLERKEKGNTAAAQPPSPRRPSSDDSLTLPSTSQNTDSRMPTTMAEFRRVLAVEMAPTIEAQVEARMGAYEKAVTEARQASLTQVQALLAQEAEKQEDSVKSLYQVIGSLAKGAQTNNFAEFIQSFARATQNDISKFRLTPALKASLKAITNITVPEDN